MKTSTSQSCRAFHNASRSLSTEEITAALTRTHRRAISNYLVRRAAGHPSGCRVMRPYEVEIMFHYILGAADLAGGLANIKRFTFMLRERLGNGRMNIAFERDHAAISIRYGWTGGQCEKNKDATLESLEILLYFLQWAVDSESVFDAIQVPWPFDARTHEVLLKLSRQVSYGSDQIRIDIGGGQLAQPIVKTAAQIRSFYALLPFYLTFGFTRTLNERNYYLQLVRSHFNQHKTLPALGDLAQLCGQSPSSLKRHLAQSDISFRALIAEFRFEGARQLLQEGRLSIKEIAFKLGYQDHNAFRRAFKVWSGLQPSRWRAEPQALPGL